MTWVTHYVGFTCLVISFCVGRKQILLGPKMVNYPNARPTTRVAMFVLCGLFLMRGADLLWGAFIGQGQHLSPVSAFPSTGLAIYFAVQLAEIEHQRLPARIWARVNRGLEIATCETLWARVWAWISGRPTFAQVRRRAAKGRPVMAARDAAHLMGEAVLSGVDFAGPPRESPADYIKRNRP